jgi:Tol biopolymer transport system component
MITAALALLLAVPAHAAKVPYSGEGHAYHPVFSPDGGYVAFEVNRYEGKIELFISRLNGVRADAAARVTLPAGSSFYGDTVTVNPVWVPEGGVVFEGSNAGGIYRLYFVLPGGGAASEMVKPTEVDGHLTFPTVSPDGKKLGFVAKKTGNGDVRVRDTQTGKIVHVTRTDGSESFPIFSADGKEMLYTRKWDNTEDIFGMDLFTESEHGVIGGAGDQTRPVYAAGGHIVYFDSGRVDGHWDVVVVDSEGQGRIVLGEDVRLPLRARPAVSPDGKWIAYGYDAPMKANRIVLARIDGSKKVEIMTDQSACGEPALAESKGRTVLAYTALPTSGSEWRFLMLRDVTDQLK